MNRALERKNYELRKTKNGYQVIPPEHKGLVLSGGGSKGIAYAGMLRAMDERGYLKNIEYVSGASAGAITAAIVALGVSTENIEKLLRDLNLSALLDRPDYSARATGERLRNCIELISFYQMREHLQLIEKPIPQSLKERYAILQNKVSGYEYLLQSQGITIDNFDDIISISGDTEALKRVDAAFAQYPKQLHNAEGDNLEHLRLTFNDLHSMQLLLPDHEQHRIKHLSVVVTNQSKHRMDTYDWEKQPGASIAGIVQLSGAHPILFAPGTNEMGHSIADGGIMDNMPASCLLEKGLNREELLCVKLMSERKFDARIRRAMKARPATAGYFGLFDGLAKRVLGGRLFSRRADLANREKVYLQLNNMLYLNSGTIETTTTSSTEQEKRQAIDSSYDITHFLLGTQIKTFRHPFLAMMYLGRTHALASTNAMTEKDSNFLASADYVFQIYKYQGLVMTALVNGNEDQVNKGLQTIENIMQEIVNDERIEDFDAGIQKAATALCLKQINFASHGDLNTFLEASAKKETSSERKSWYNHLLDLLWMPIQWLISLFNGKETTKKHEIADSNNDTSPKDHYNVEPEVNENSEATSHDKAVSEEKSERYNDPLTPF